MSSINFNPQEYDQRSTQKVIVIQGGNKKPIKLVLYTRTRFCSGTKS